MELNRLKVVLVEKKRTGKWLAEKLGKNEATVFGGVRMSPSHRLKHYLPLRKR